MIPTHAFRLFLILFIAGTTSALALEDNVSQLHVDPTSGRLRLEVGSVELDLGQVQFTSRKAGAGEHILLDQVTPSGSGSWILSGDSALGKIGVAARVVTGGEIELTVDLARLNRTGLFRPVIALGDAGVSSFAASAPPRRAGAKVVARTDLGLVVVAAEYDPTNVARAMVVPGDGSLISWRLHSRVIDLPEIPTFRLRFRVESKSSADARAALAGRLQRQNADTVARLEAWYSLMGEAGGAAVQDLGARLESFDGTLDAKLARARDDQRLLFQAFLSLREEAGQMAGVMSAILRDHREALRAAARTRFDGMNYRAGLARDGRPDAEDYDDWALFRMGLVRLAVNPVWHDGLDRATRIKRVREALDEVDAFGGKVVLSVHEEQEAQGPADLSFTNEFIPALRSGFHELGFNSARLRRTKLEVFGDWLEATRGHPAIWTYKIDNEPFWSTQEYPIFGYDEATVGCDPEVFAAALREVYPSLADWRNRIAGTLAEAVIPWREWSDVALAPGEAEGLTFIEYLRNRYRTLDELNRVWGSDYPAWSRIFPPLPAVADGREADDSGAPEFDIGAFNPGPQPHPSPRSGEEVRWADWTRFWAHNINDELRGYVALGRSRGTAVSITTNCLAGHMLVTGDVTHSLFPWVTSDGLDALAIDFYRIGYLQGYLRTLAGAAAGRPIEIHETGGSDSAEEAWYMTAFAYAYGSRGTVFWRRDHHLPPTSALGIARAIDVLDHADLQNDSEPFTDGILMVYPFEGLHAAGAWGANPSALIEAMQGAVILAKRRQWQYTMVADQDLATALNDGRIRSVVVPAGVYLAPSAWAALERFVDQGGTAVVTSDIGTRDERGAERPQALRTRFLEHAGVRVVAGEAWRELVAGVTGPRDARLGLIGSTPDALLAVDEFVRASAPALIRYVSAEGHLAPTHAAIRTSDEAIYVFIDPWADGVRLECALPVVAVQDLATGASIALKRTGEADYIEVPGGATIVRIEVPAKSARYYAKAR